MSQAEVNRAISQLGLPSEITANIRSFDKDSFTNEKYLRSVLPGIKYRVEQARQILNDRYGDYPKRMTERYLKKVLTADFKSSPELLKKSGDLEYAKQEIKKLKLKGIKPVLYNPGADRDKHNPLQRRPLGLRFDGVRYVKVGGGYERATIDAPNIDLGHLRQLNKDYGSKQMLEKIHQGVRDFEPDLPEPELETTDDDLPEPELETTDEDEPDLDGSSKPSKYRKKKIADPFEAETETDEEENMKNELVDNYLEMVRESNPSSVIGDLSREIMEGMDRDNENIRMEMEDYRRYPGMDAVLKDKERAFKKAVRQDIDNPKPIKPAGRGFVKKGGGRAKLSDFRSPTVKKPKLRIKARVVGRRMRDGRLEVKGSKNSKCYTRENNEGEKYITCQPRYY